MSIGLPVFNGEAFLEESIESLLAQTFTDFELLISDNASTDRTEEICRRYVAQDRRVRYWRNPQNIGGLRNANLVFERARGEFFRWAADDDVCAPTMLERLIVELDARPDVAVCFAAATVVDVQGEPLRDLPIGRVAVGKGGGLRVLKTDEEGVRYPTEGTAAKPSDRVRELMSTQALCEATYGLIRADVLRETVLQRAYTASDTVMLCDLAARGRFHLVREPLFRKRLHDGNRYPDRGPGRMVWARPELAESGRPTCPHWLQFMGYLEVAIRAPLPLAERARCMAAILRFARLRWRALAFDLRFALAMMMHSKEWRRACYAPENW